MRPLKIPKFRVKPDDAEKVNHIFAFVTPQSIDKNNWAADYPYAPQVTFRIFHSAEHLFVRFDVTEQYTMAAVTEDQGEVWTDSCVELFMALDDTGYYNFETTCIGTMLLAFRKERPNPEYAPTEVMKSVVRTTTLAPLPFAEREGSNRWSVTLAIPASALFRHKISSWDGLNVRLNLYKCGDKLSHPHYLSWQPITTPQPNFHQPDHFAPAELA